MENATTRKTGFQRAKEQADQLRALKATHARVIEALHLMIPVVEEQAMLGDSLAKFALKNYEEARTAMQAENVAAGSLVADQTQT